MTVEPHHTFGALLLALVSNYGVAVMTVGSWLVDKLPSFAACLSIAFTLWQWQRKLKKDQAYAAIQRENQDGTESNPQHRAAQDAGQD